MRGMTEDLTIGERVAWYRRRRGLSQDVLAGLNGRTTDWLSKAENNRIELDRLSVIRRLAETLDVSLGDLVGEPTLFDWTADSGTSTVPALRAALMDYRQLTPILSAPSTDSEPPDLSELAQELSSVFDAYQASRFGFAAGRAPLLLADAIHAAREYDGDAGERANELLALSYQAAASVLTKLGESDLAWMAAERGLAAAQQANSYAVTGSLFRSVAFSLLATGRTEPAMQLVEDGASYLEPHLNDGHGETVSAYGMLFLAGSMAASRSENRSTTRTYLDEAERAAGLLGEDRNHMWTAFGPTNVAIHRVNTAMELGDVQIALDQGPDLNTSALPTERQVRHRLEVARAYNLAGRRDDAIAQVLDAEQIAHEQVRHHYLSRNLVLGWVRNSLGRPPVELDQLARRMKLVG